MKTYVVVQRRHGETRVVGVYLTMAKAMEVADTVCGEALIEKHIAVK